MKSTLFLFLWAITWNIQAMNDDTSLIDSLIERKNYSVELWEPRGLMPSSNETIFILETTTYNFLVALKKIQLQANLDTSQKRQKVQELVDALPWLDYDTEEKEFLADTIAPAIKSIGFDPWSII